MKNQFDTGYEDFVKILLKAGFTRSDNYFYCYRINVANKYVSVEFSHLGCNILIDDPPISISSLNHRLSEWDILEYLTRRVPELIPLIANPK